MAARDFRALHTMFGRSDEITRNAAGERPLG
jgi:hypothetical protein